MKVQNGRRSFLKYMLSFSAFIAGSTLSFNKNKGFKTGKISRTEARAMGAAGKRVKKIAVEEHCYTEDFVAWQVSRTEFKGRDPEEETILRARNLGEGRLNEMDEAGIDMQVISLAYPGLDIFKTADAIALSKMVNDKISETVKRYPDRFAGYCCIPLQDPEAAADELERAVTKLGLQAAMVNENTPDRWLSDQKYEVIFERLAKLDVPIYLHWDGPTSDYPGNHIVPEVLRLVNSDLFNRYPGLQIILGHGGEGLPFWLWRRGSERGVMSDFGQVFKKHFYVTTSDQRSDILLQFLIAALGADRIMFATDYPFESGKDHVDWIDSAPISDSDREKICHLNAEKLFRL
ncbi:amidohydrolase family protein [Deltaproteobacteria bacterium]|nr:amidohydrolase family protein [Deltaproteobacteria bacterium]